MDVNGGVAVARSGADSELIYGINAVERMLQTHPERVLELHHLDGRHDERFKALLALAARAGAAQLTHPREHLDDMVQGGRHQGVVARVRPSAPLDQGELEALLDGLEAPPLLLVLDQVQDPHNLGACLRTAEAAGVVAVVVPRDRSAGLTPAARKVASGAAETVPLAAVPNLARCLRMLKDRGIWLVGLAGETETNLFQTDLKGPIALVMGAEGGGLRRLTREHCDHLVRIPMRGGESLNVSVAAGIAVFEAVRQRDA